MASPNESAAIGAVDIPVLNHIVQRNQVWSKMAEKHGVSNPVPPWKTSLDGLCDALDRATCDLAIPSLKDRPDEEDTLSETRYLGLPHPESQLVSLAHSLIARGIVTESELRQRLADIRARLEA